MGDMNIKLNKSIEKFKYITEKSLMGITILQDGELKYFNEKFIEICGYSAEEIKSWAPNGFSKFIYIEDRDFVMEQASKKQAGYPDVVNQYKFRIRRKDGKIRWVEIFSKTINYEGHPADLVTINDITDKINAEKELIESDEKYRNILENMMEGYFETDLSGKLLYANAEFCKISGFSREEMIGKDTRLIYDKESRKILSDLFNEVYNTGIPRPPSGLVKVRTIKKKLIYFEGSLDLLYDSEGNKVGFYGFVRDITQRKIAEQKLKESEEKFRYIADHSLLGITILQDGVLKYFNKKVAETYGVSEEEMKNWSPGQSLKLIHPDDLEFVKRQGLKMQSGESNDVFNYKYRIVKKDGKIEWREVFSKSIIYEGRPAGFGIHIDITEKIEAERKLKESEEKFRNITEQSLVGISIIQDGRYKYFNKRFCEMSGYSPEEINSWVSNEFAKVVHPDDRDFVMEQAFKKQVGDSDVVNQYSYRIIRKDGEIRWFEILSKTINYEGHPADLAMIIDITDKIKAERQLRDSEDKFSKAFNSNVLSMSISSFEDGKFIEVNDAFLNYVGHSREEVIGKTTDELGLWVSEKVRKRFIRLIDKHGSLFNIETKDIPRTGETKYGLVSYIKIMLNEKPFLLSILNNITPRKLAEQQLKESEEKFRYIADHSLLGITILQDGVFKYFNKKVAETFGGSEEEIENWGPGESIKFIHPDDRDLVIRQALKVQRGEFDDAVNYKYRIVKKDGKIGWRETFSKSIIYEGRPAGFGIHIDITEKIEAERKLKESREKYLRAYNQAEFYKDLFIHDINNTLQSLYSSTQLIDIDLEEDRKNNNINELIDIMYRQINRGINLISNVRKLSQLENHEISLKEIDFFDVLKQSIEFLKNTFQDRNIQIKYDISCENVPIIGNELLQDVFENILINSVRHNNNDCVEIVIKTSHVKQDDKSYCKLEIIDNGIGIEDERKKNVLNRADPDAKTTYGMGLGLSLVKKIIDSYGGKIWIEDKVEGEYSKGTKVILLIQKGGS